MTINQTIQEAYIGKKISLIITEQKDEAGNVSIFREPQIGIAESKEWHKIPDTEIWWREVAVIDKVTSIRKVQSYWLFTMLSGRVVKFTADTEMPNTMPEVMRLFPTIKQRYKEMKEQIKNWKYGAINESDFGQGFMSGYNWAKRELTRNIANMGKVDSPTNN